MEVLGHIISDKTEGFVNKTLEAINKPVDFYDLSVLGARGVGCFGALEELNDCFNLYASIDLDNGSFECNIAHELLHAVQYSDRFPYVVSIHNDNAENSFGSAYRALILDLGVEESLAKHGFDSSYFKFIRYNKIKEKPYKIATDILGNDYMEKLTAIDLSLVYFESTAQQWDSLINDYKGRLDIVLDLTLQIVDIIEKVGFSTKEQALVCFGEINTLFNLWDKFSLYDGTGNCYGKSQYRIWARDLRKKFLGT